MTTTMTMMVHNNTADPVTLGDDDDDADGDDNDNDDHDDDDDEDGGGGDDDEDDAATRCSSSGVPPTIGLCKCMCHTCMQFSLRWHGPLFGVPRCHGTLIVNCRRACRSPCACVTVKDLSYDMRCHGAVVSNVHDCDVAMILAMVRLRHRFQTLHLE